MVERRCISCWQTKERDDLIKITRTTENLAINPNNFTFGRSAYLCYNEACIEKAFKKDRLAKHLKATIPNELKGRLLNELRYN